MTASHSIRSKTVTAETPPVPLTTEGYSVLHQMMRFRRTAWRVLPEAERAAIAEEASSLLAAMEQNSGGQSALYSLIGHKGDLMLIHFRESFADLNQAELKLAHLRLSDYLEPTSSYLSIIELGLYDSTLKIYKERARQMSDHGMIGRRYAGEVKQIISGSIGFDDWEWGVDLFADDPLVFKKLIYEMRFDEVSAVYALFGQFFVGVRCPAAALEQLLNGELK